VKRLAVGDVKHALTYLLWDTETQRLISISEHRLTADALWARTGGPATSSPRPA
jgi:hypothetical protein